MKKTISTLLAFVVLSTLFLAGCSNGAKQETTPDAKVPAFEELVDFVVQAEEGREFRILQLTDTQIIDPGQSRYPERIGNTTPLTDEQLYADCFYFIEETVKQTQPDLILMTGDNVYGEFDDNGTSTEKLVDFMESLQIPWAPVFGNHDNETTKGVTWQCQQFEQAEHCLFKRGETIGNGNYTIGVQQGDRLIKVIYMMDSNGCGNGKSYSYQPAFGEYNKDEKIMTVAGFGEDQIEWLDMTSSKITGGLGYTPTKFIAFHIPITEFSDAATAKGYQSSDRQKKFVIEDATGEDFGEKNESIGGFIAPNFWMLLQRHKFDGVFVGHNHVNNFSIVHEGIRLTFGVKSSAFDYHQPDMLGGTLITVAEGGESFQVEHIYVRETVAE